MIVIVFIVWIVLVSILLQNLPWEVFLSFDITNKIAIIGVLVWVIFTLLFACYNLFSFLFSLIYRYKYKIGKNHSNTPPVALFYTCKNDFSKNAIIALKKQDYKNCNVYILDDSTDTNEIKSIDQFLKPFKKDINIIRRIDNEGYKAGNINNAIRIIGKKYKYICIIDADEIVPINFVTELVSIAEANPEYVFIQASHVQYGITEYSKSTGDGIDLHWNYFLPARNKNGFLFFYGHGALLRLKEIIDMGGIPEIVSEDIALTAAYRTKGLRGYFTHEVTSYVEVPLSYNSFRRKNRKIIQGTLEFYYKHSKQFFMSSNVPFFEKIDLVLASMTIYLPVIYLLFVLFLHVIMPLVSVIFNSTLIHAKYWGLTEFYFSNLFLWLVGFTIVSPLLYVIPSFIRQPIKSFFSIFRLGTIYLSSTVYFTRAFLDWFKKDKIDFIPTGDRSTVSKKIKFINSEFLIGLVLVAISIITQLPFLLALGLSLIFVPFLLKNNLKTKMSRFLTLIPFFIIFIILFNQPFEALGMIGMTGFLAMANP